MTTVRRFINLLIKDKKDLVYLYTYGALQGIINLSLPIGIQAIMSLVLAGRLSASWTILTLLVTIGVIVAGLFQLFQIYIVEILQRKLFVRAAFEFAYRIPHFKIKALGTSYAPEFVHRFFDVVGLQKNLNKVLLDFSSSAIQILFGLVLLSLYHPVFIGFGLVLIIILVLIIYLTFKSGLATSIRESDSKYKMAYWLTELARSMTTFKLQGSNDLALKQTDKIASEYIQHRKKHFRIVVSQLVSILSLKTLVTAGLLIIGALLLISNSITIGQFVASEIVIILVLNSSEKLIGSLEPIYDLLTSVEKIGKVTDLQLDRDSKHENAVAVPNHEPLSLSVSNLTISGVVDDKPIIENLSFEVKPGEHLCITGKSGSGKSTLIKTLSSLLDSYEGSIQVNGIPSNNIDVQSYRAANRVIFSDQEIFYGTLLDNIGLQQPEVTTEEIIEIIDRVGLKPVVDLFPNGYYEMITNAERMLSKTDRIRLITARALVGKPGIVFVEDVFAELDEVIAKDLIGLLIECCQNTTLVISSNQSRISKMCNKTLELSHA